MRRLLVLLVVAVGLAPGTWVRTTLPPPDKRQVLEFRELRVPRADLGPLALTGAWQIDSPNSDFGSYSALVALGDDALLAASDHGSMLLFSIPGGRSSRVAIGDFVGRKQAPKALRDVEALTRDPTTGRLWAAFEWTNRIERVDADFASALSVRPAAMRDWAPNQGPEAMVRLSDGRFIVLAEGSEEWFGDEMPALLFPADPVARTEPVRFRFAPPAGFRPVDSAQLPDGRVLILLRSVEWMLPPRFAGKLVIADPRDIAADKPWHATLVADLAAPLPIDNYEGLAVESDGAGGAVLWVISDDNNSGFQQTLLLRLLWPANDKARGGARAPE